MRNKEIIQHTRQRVWGKIAVLNFCLGGSGAGFYVLMFIFISVIDSSVGHNHNHYKLIAPTIVAIAFLALAYETRFPVRISYLFNNLHSSWISRETFFGAAFILCAVTDFFFPHAFFKMCAITSAFGYLISQSLILYCAKAIPTWNTGSLPISFVFSSIYGGIGWLMLTISSYELKDVNVILIIFLLLVSNIVVWLIYMSKLKMIYSSCKYLGFQHQKMTYFSLAAGLLLPIVMLILLLLSVDSRGNEAWYQAGFRIFTAAWIIGYSIFQKTKTIIDFSQLRSVNLSFPERSDRTYN